MNELFFITKHQLISWLRNLGMLMKFGSLDSEGGKSAVLILYFFNKKVTLQNSNFNLLW